MPLYHTVYSLINNLDSIKYVQQRKQKNQPRTIVFGFLAPPHAHWKYHAGQTASVPSVPCVSCNPLLLTRNIRKQPQLPSN